MENKNAQDQTIDLITTIELMKEAGKRCGSDANCEGCPMDVWMRSDGNKSGKSCVAYFAETMQEVARLYKEEKAENVELRNRALDAIDKIANLEVEVRDQKRTVHTICRALDMLMDRFEGSQYV